VIGGRVAIFVAMLASSRVMVFALVLVITGIRDADDPAIEPQRMKRQCLTGESCKNACADNGGKKKLAIHHG
jgi:hypothetical protein